MNDMQRDLDDLGRQLWPRSDALRPARTERSGQKVLGRLITIVAVALIAAGVVLFAAELTAHRDNTRISQPASSPHPVRAPSPLWSPNPLPAPRTPLVLYSTPNLNLMPALVRVLVPETQGMGDASVTIVPDGELFIQYSCVGPGSFVVRTTNVPDPDPAPASRPGCTSSPTPAYWVGTASPAYPNKVLKASDLGKPVTFAISAAPATTWALYIAESVPPAPPSVVSKGWIAAAANPWTVGGGENGDVYLLSPGAGPRPIIGSDGDGLAQQCPAFSPDGQQLAYAEARASGTVTSFRGVWPVSDRAVVVVGVSADGDPSPPLLRASLPTGAGEIACPEWSPNGRDVAYRVGADLWVADTTTGRTTRFRVLATPWGENGFAWSRDGSRIAVAEPGQIRVVPIDGSAPTVIPVQGGTPGSHTGSIAWTANDVAIVYEGTDPQADGEYVYRVNADGANDTLLAYGSGAAVSPDGTRIAYIDFSQHVVTMQASGGKAVAVDIPAGLLLEGVGWSPDGRRLLLSSVDGVVSVSVAPGPPPIAYANGNSYSGLNLEWSWSEVTWQPVTGAKQ